MAKVVRMHTNTEIDHSTGEIRRESKTDVLHFPSEPPYIKMYLDDISTLLSIPDSEKRVLTLMLKKLDYDGYITLSKRYRMLMCEQLGIKDQVLRNKIAKLKKSGVIASASYGEYMVNPNLFARGQWKDVVEQRRRFEMRISYSPDGERRIETEVVEEQPDFFE